MYIGPISIIKSENRYPTDGHWVRNWQGSVYCKPTNVSIMQASRFRVFQTHIDFHEK